jgi:hypothetical protein
MPGRENTWKVEKRGGSWRGGVVEERELMLPVRSVLKGWTLDTCCIMLLCSSISEEESTPFAGGSRLESPTPGIIDTGTCKNHLVAFWQGRHQPFDGPSCRERTLPILVYRQLPLTWLYSMLASYLIGLHVATETKDAAAARTVVNPLRKVVETGYGALSSSRPLSRWDSSTLRVPTSGRSLSMNIRPFVSRQIGRLGSAHNRQRRVNEESDYVQVAMRDLM